LVERGDYCADKDKDTQLDGGKGFLTSEQMKKREMVVMGKMLMADQQSREAAGERTKADV
jgi:hypothetical protein